MRDKLRRIAKSWERYLNEVVHAFRLKVKGFVHANEIIDKLFILFQLAVEVCLTGFTVHYTLTNFNWLSVGLAIVVGQYYLKWLVSIIRKANN